jgi:hypothetical protein
MPSTLRANTLALLYADTGRLSEAESLLRRTLEIQQRALGEENPEAANTMANLASVFVRRKMAVEADSLYRWPLAILDRSRPDDRKLVSVLTDYAWLLRQTGKSREGVNTCFSLPAWLMTRQLLVNHGSAPVCRL